MNPPVLYIIAGCNGAGKTTASMSVLPQVLDCREFVNADEIAKGLSPFKPEEVAIEAGKLMLQRIDWLLSRRATFAIETTLATKSYKNLVLKAKDLSLSLINSSNLFTYILINPSLPVLMDLSTICREIPSMLPISA